MIEVLFFILNWFITFVIVLAGYALLFGATNSLKKLLLILVPINIIMIIVMASIG